MTWVPSTDNSDTKKLDAYIPRQGDALLGDH